MFFFSLYICANNTFYFKKQIRLIKEFNYTYNIGPVVLYIWNSIVRVRVFDNTDNEINAVFCAYPYMHGQSWMYIGPYPNAKANVKYYISVEPLAKR